MIKLIKKGVAGIVNAATGGSVTLSNGSAIALPANAVVKVTGGSAYSGIINVYATYIDPTGDNIAQLVPGSFMADDRNNQRVVLSSYGMLAVELESAAGEKLQIAPGSAATLTNAIPSSVQSSAPATIALWYVDEKTGIWREEGIAVKNGNNYIGEVKHFSFWNWDVPMAAVTLSVTLKTGKAVPLANAVVKLASIVSGSPSQVYGYTDSLGQVSGFIPANQPIVLEVLDPCNNVIYIRNIGSLSQDTDLGIITINNSGSSSLVTIEGQLKSCSNLPVTDGYAIINYDNTSRYVSVNDKGEFATSFLRCSGGSPACEVLGVDASTQQQGSIINVLVTSPITNAGNISACGTSALQFINYTIDGTNYSISSAVNDSLGAYTYETQITPPLATDIQGSNMSGSDNIWLYFEHTASAATYDVADFNVAKFDSIALVRPFTVTISNHPTGTGGFYEGSFSGQFMELGAPVPIHNVNGTFRVRRL